MKWGLHKEEQENKPLIMIKNLLKAIIINCIKWFIKSISIISIRQCRKILIEDTRAYWRKW